MTKTKTATVPEPEYVVKLYKEAHANLIDAQNEVLKQCDYMRANVQRVTTDVIRAQPVSHISTVTESYQQALGRYDEALKRYGEISELRSRLAYEAAQKMMKIMEPESAAD